MDRIDIFVDVTAVTPADLSLPAPLEGSRDVAARIAGARRLQEARFENAPAERRRLNVDASAADIDALFSVENSAQELMLQAAEKMGLSARGYYRTLKVARTIADLEGGTAIARHHAAEALTYRQRSVELPTLQTARS